MQLVALDYALIALYLALMVFIGVFFGWFIKDVGAYLKGNNTIPWPIAGISNFMSMFSTFVFVGHAGIAYEHGLIAVVVFWSTIPACLFAARFMAARWRRAQLTTPVEYLEQRFNMPVRQVFSWAGLAMRLLDNAVRLYASGIFLSTVTPLSVSEAVVLSGVLITIFTMFGGLWAVTVMDTIQFIVLFFATLILVPLSLQAAGGLSGIAANAPQHLHWFNGPKGMPLWLLAYYVMIVLKYNGNWAFIQRLYAVRDEKSARKVAYCSAVLFAVTPLIFLLPAVAARVVVPDLADPETSYVAVCALLLPAGMMGLMIASMFSATCSALNSEFNVMAGVVTNDLYKRVFAPASSDRSQFRFARIMTVVIGGLITSGAVFVGYFGGAFEANKLFTGILAIPLAVPLVFGLLMGKPNSTGALVVVLGGATLALELNLAGWFKWEVSTLITIVACTAVFAVFGLISPTQKEKVAPLFKQLNTPLSPGSIPRIDTGFLVALKRLFSLSLLISGSFFAVVSVLALGDLSGRLALVAAILCIGLGVAFRTMRMAEEGAADG
jgi:SSS family transporter